MKIVKINVRIDCHKKNAAHISCYLYTRIVVTFLLQIVGIFELYIKKMENLRTNAATIMSTLSRVFHWALVYGVDVWFIELLAKFRMQTLYIIDTE